MSERNVIGNSSTIIKYILVMIATRTLALAAAHGLNLPVSATELAEIFGYMIGFIIATIDAKYPNNIFNHLIEVIIHNETTDEDVEEDLPGEDNDI